MYSSLFVISVETRNHYNMPYKFVFSITMRCINTFQFSNCFQAFILTKKIGNLITLTLLLPLEQM